MGEKVFQFHKSVEPTKKSKHSMVDKASDLVNAHPYFTFLASLLIIISLAATAAYFVKPQQRDIQFFKAKSSKQNSRDVERYDLKETAAMVSVLDTTNYSYLEKHINRMEDDYESSVQSISRAIAQKGHSRNVYLNGLHILGRLAPRSEPSIQIILSYLNHADPEYRGAAAAALGKMRHAAKFSVPRLANIIRNDKEKWVRDMARVALERIGSNNAKRALATAEKS